MLGDTVHEALAIVGITTRRVSDLLGDCCCEERRQRLNDLDRWARRVVSGKIDNAVEYLNRMLEVK